jgi:hypothetical protein
VAARLRTATSLAVGGAVLAACGSDPSGPLPESAWGGVGVALNVSASGGQAEFDCAAGTLLEGIELASDGSFDAKGLFVHGTGGPVREDNPPAPLAARYTGRVENNRMSLTVILRGSGENVGPFALERDAQPVLRRCL